MQSLLICCTLNDEWEEHKNEYTICFTFLPVLEADLEILCTRHPKIDLFALRYFSADVRTDQRTRQF